MILSNESINDPLHIGKLEIHRIQGHLTPNFNTENWVIYTIWIRYDKIE